MEQDVIEHTLTLPSPIEGEGNTETLSQPSTVEGEGNVVRHLRLDLAYDGTEYSGWQYQDNARSLERTLQDALLASFGRKVPMIAAGRTDAGVHAEQQVVVIRLDHPIPPHNLRTALNARLPDDFVVTSVQEVPAGFNPRNDAEERVYRYAILNNPFDSAFHHRFALHIKRRVNWEAVAAAGQYLVGRHDFGGFRSINCDSPTTVRLMKVFRLEHRPPYAFLYFAAHAFLRHMVRVMVGTLLEIGDGLRPPEDIPRLLECPNRDHAGPTAPAHGLTLLAVCYPGEPLWTTGHRPPNPFSLWPEVPGSAPLG